MRATAAFWFAPWACLLGLATQAVGADALRAGAARVDITPAANASLPMAGYGSRVQGHEGIHDNLYARALVLDDGTRAIALVSCDLLWISDELRDSLAPRLARENGLAREAIVIAATHTHGAPTVSTPKPEFEPRWREWRAMAEDRIAEAVRRARAALQPARIGAATGKANVNTNRRARLASGGWGLGINPEGPSDKTVGVVKVESLAGEPIAVVINYAVHGTVLGPRNLKITGDLPGAAARYVEREAGDRLVALWTSAASGDQNAIYSPGVDFGQAEVLGRILGEEVVRTAARVRTSPRARLHAAQRTVECPGRVLTPDSKPHDNRMAFADAAPVTIRLSLLQAGPLAFAGVSGEVLTGIGEHLKRESPYSRTFMVTHANGSSGYIPDDAAYAQISYEIWISRLKPGCAETAIVDSFRQMMEETW